MSGGPLAWLLRRVLAKRPPAPVVEVPDDRRVCANCRQFRNDPAEMEAALPGLAALSSGHGSTRDDDGLCLRHDRFVTPTSTCPAFARGSVLSGSRRARGSLAAARRRDPPRP